jgi:hypothetical protein
MASNAAPGCRDTLAQNEISWDCNTWRSGGPSPSHPAVTSFDFLDTTTIHDNARSQVPGLPAAATFSMDHIWDTANAGQIAMKTASDAQAKRAFKFTFGTGGQIMVFAGYVGFDGRPGGSAQQIVTTTSAITMQGTPTYYAS